MAETGSAELRTLLRGIDYPVSREDVLASAQRAGADETVLRRLRELPNHTYHGPAAVSDEFARIA